MTTTPDGVSDGYDTLTPEQLDELSDPCWIETVDESYPYILDGNKVADALQRAYALGQQHERERPKCIIDGRPAAQEWPDGLLLENGETIPAYLCQRCYDRCNELGELEWGE